MGRLTGHRPRRRAQELASSVWVGGPASERSRGVLAAPGNSGQNSQPQVCSVSASEGSAQGFLPSVCMGGSARGTGARPAPGWPPLLGVLPEPASPACPWPSLPPLALGRRGFPRKGMHVDTPTPRPRRTPTCQWNAVCPSVRQDQRGTPGPSPPTAHRSAFQCPGAPSRRGKSNQPFPQTQKKENAPNSFLHRQKEPFACPSKDALASPTARGRWVWGPRVPALEAGGRAVSRGVAHRGSTPLDREDVRVLAEGRRVRGGEEARPFAKCVWGRVRN